MASTDPNTQALYDVAHLASCAVRELAPDPERVSQMDLDLVYREASRQLLAACCAFALEAVDMCIEGFTQAKVTCIRRTVFMDQQHKEALDRLEEAA